MRPFNVFDAFGALRGAGAGASSVLFSRDFASNLSLGASATFTRSTTATVTDFEGLVKNCLAGEARIPGARQVRNLIPTNSWNFLAAPWVSRATNISIEGGYADPFGGTNAFRCTATGSQGRTSCDSFANPGAGRVIRTSLWARRVSGTGYFRIYDSATGSSNYNINGLTSDWRRFSTVATISDDAGRFPGFIVFNSGDVVDVCYFQVTDVTGQANQNPSEDLPVGLLSSPYYGANVDGVKYFATENGNTVDANGVVTEATGAAISGVGGLLMEPQRTNYANNSDDLSGGADTIDLTTGGTGDYTLSVSGDAAVTVAAGTATGTGFAQATAGNDVTFNLSAAGTVILTLDGGSFDTVNGLADYQVEKGSVATTWIPNSTTATTRNADALSYSGIAASNETRAVVDGANADADDWDGVVDATLLGADNLGEIASITAYKPGARPA